MKPPAVPPHDKSATLASQSAARPISPMQRLVGKLRFVQKKLEEPPLSFRWGLMLAVLGALGFSAKAIFVKLAYAANPELQPITLMTIRMAIAVPMFLLVAVLSARVSAHLSGETEEVASLRLADWGLLIALGMFGYYLAGLFDFWGLQFITAGLERMVLYLYPTLVVLMIAGVERKSVSARSWQAMALGYLGIAVMMFNDGLHLGEGVVIGVVLVFVSALFFAVFLVGNGMLVQRLGSTRFTTWVMSLAGLFTGMHFAAVGSVADLLQPMEVYRLALMMAIFSTVLPAYMMNAGIRRLGAGHASLVSTVGPVSTLFLAAIFLGEAITVLQLVGTGLVLLGISRLK